MARLGRQNWFKALAGAVMVVLFVYLALPLIGFQGLFLHLIAGFGLFAVSVYWLMGASPIAAGRHPRRNLLWLSLLLLGATGAFIGAGWYSPQAGEFELTPLKAKYEHMKTDIGKGMAIYFDETVGQCVYCHKVGELGGRISGRLVGPEFTDIGSRKLPYSYLQQSIVDPWAWPAAGFEDRGEVMPPFYAKRLTPQEIDYLVAFLQNLTIPCAEELTGHAEGEEHEEEEGAHAGAAMEGMGDGHGEEAGEGEHGHGEEGCEWLEAEGGLAGHMDMNMDMGH